MFEELKQRQSVVWGAGPFERVQGMIADMHDDLVAQLDLQPGDRFLDVGCGTGGVAERAAARGAKVTAVDLAPALVETAKRRAAERGLDIDYSVGDAEALEFDDASFDVVASSVGAIFAPDHAAVARELARVTRPGGRVGLTAWHPEGRIGDFFRLMVPFQPPLPDGAGSPLRWGDPAYARELLGGDFDVEVLERVSVLEMDSVDEYWEIMSTSFGPIVTALERNDDEGKMRIRAAFFADAASDTRADGSIRQERTYVLVLGRRR
ncbi:MAG: class I SAM-dependent methyltransferase [Actinobacteria bacterium]|nr:class I SAM-dependent methyltransferase [Actinomycetota bacterium]